MHMFSSDPKNTIAKQVLIRYQTLREASSAGYSVYFTLRDWLSKFKGTSDSVSYDCTGIKFILFKLFSAGDKYLMKFSNLNSFSLLTGATKQSNEDIKGRSHFCLPIYTLLRRCLCAG